MGSEVLHYCVIISHVLLVHVSNCQHYLGPFDLHRHKYIYTCAVFGYDHGYFTFHMAQRDNQYLQGTISGIYDISGVDEVLIPRSGAVMATSLVSMLYTNS